MKLCKEDTINPITKLSNDKFNLRFYVFIKFKSTTLPSLLSINYKQKILHQY
jgi:hypothetical protein